ncbi:MAG TPA: cold shock domain-containing protein [Candidatus Paceibacterota bacterium]|nr:cold shock domain-containing protein [Candidatus Paceibacterota bacterium]
MKGKIARVTDRGFGFITPDSGEKDLFFHARSLMDGLMFDSLKEGEEVTFEIEQGDKGPSAVNVARA